MPPDMARTRIARALVLIVFFFLVGGAAGILVGAILLDWHVVLTGAVSLGIGIGIAEGME